MDTSDVCYFLQNVPHKNDFYEFVYVIPTLIISYKNYIIFYLLALWVVLIIILRKNMKKIILKYLKSNSKKLVLIVSGFHFLGPRFGGPPKSNGGRKTFERQINKYKN